MMVNKRQTWSPTSWSVIARMGKHPSFCGSEIFVNSGPFPLKRGLKDKLYSHPADW